MKLVLWKIGGILFVGGAVAQAEVGQELAVNGSFEQADGAGTRPAGWSWPGENAAWMEAAGNRWIRLRDNASLDQTIELQPDWWKLDVSVRVKCTGVELGTEGWHDARVAMMFADEAGERVGDWPPVMHWTGTFDWRTESKVFFIPRGAKRLYLSCSIFNTRGRVEFDDLSVKLVAMWPPVEDAQLPPGVVARWDAARAFRMETPTRGRLCLNGLWNFHPAGAAFATLPPAGSGWGWLKVPASWAPGSGVQPFGPDLWETEGPYHLSQSLVAWYRRRATAPTSWQGRRIFLAADNVVREALVFVNGQEAGRLTWPDGRVELTDRIVPGEAFEVALRASAIPVAPAEWAGKSAEERRQLAAGVRVRGLCGDVFLESEPRGTRIDSVLAQPSVKGHQLHLRVGLDGLRERARYAVAVAVEREGKIEQRWRGMSFGKDDLEDGLLTVAFDWPHPSLWDIDRPILYDLRVQLLADGGRLLDEFTPVRFGFRELGIEGRNLTLNGRAVHLRALDFQQPAQDGGLASETACAWALQRLRDLGLNCIYLSTYDLDWGQLRYFDGVLEAADRLGFLMSVTLPHPNRLRNIYQDPQKRADWERIARWVVRKAANHPSVILYAMSHNALGHEGDQNPRYLDARFEDDRLLPDWSRGNREPARWAEGFVRELDPTRLVYHHQCGNFGAWITLNCYLNWAPLQERLDWLRRYAMAGRKPIFLVEFGMPHHASFQRHRGAPFIWTNEVHAEPLSTEFAAIYFGDAAYDLAPEHLAHYDTMARVYERKGTKFFFWEVFGEVWGQRREKNFLDVKAEYTRYTWPAFRTWGIPAIAPWDWDDFGRGEAREIPLPTDWEQLQRPGFQPDQVQVSEWYQQPPGEPTNYTCLGRTLRPRNQDLLAYIAGKPEFFTSRDHLFAPGEKVRKQFVFINDTPSGVTFHYTWRARLGRRTLVHRQGRVLVPPGKGSRVPVDFPLPMLKSDAEGQLTLAAEAVGEGLAEAVKKAQLQDTFDFQVVVPPARLSVPARVGLLDPRGLTGQTLRQLGVEPVEVDPGAWPSVDLLILGREALAADEAAMWKRLDGTWAEAGLPPRERLSLPTLPRLPAWLGEFVGRGGRVLICEQTERVLSQRFGFRTAWPGTRQVFVRCPWHPVLRGLDDRRLSLWRGAATLTLDRTQAGPVGDPVVDWLGFPNTRVWKWGNYATVASVVIEKPQRGDFLPLVDCEFDLHYTPLLEYRSGAGRVIFCQFDISDRTEPEPAVRRLWANLLEYLGAPAPDMSRRTLYVGGPSEVPSPARRGAEEVLAQLGVDYQPGDPKEVQAGDLLIVGPGSQPIMAEARDPLAAAVRSGALVFALALGPSDLQDWLPFEVGMEGREVRHTPLGRSDFWLLRGLSPSDLHWRGWMRLNVLTKGPASSVILPTGVVGAVPWGKGWFVFCQASPDQFDETTRPYLRLSHQHCARLVSRLLANCGARFQDPLLRHLTSPPPLSIDLAGEWFARLDEQEEGEEMGWQRSTCGESDWLKLQAPGAWEEQWQAAKDYNGVVWYRKHFRAPEAWPDELELVLGAIDDEDWTYVNGHLVGHIGQDTHPANYWSATRRYQVAAALLRPGEDNVIAVKVRDFRQAGGIVQGPLHLRSRPRWLDSYYVNEPLATDDPYRYYRW